MNRYLRPMRFGYHYLYQIFRTEDRPHLKQLMVGFKSLQVILFDF
jgi:hypothetical protein